MKYINKILFLIVVTLGFNSCSDPLEYNEFTVYDRNQIFGSLDRTAGFVANIYSYLDYDFGSYGGAMLASATDEADYVWTSSAIHDFYNGAWSAVNPKSSVWTNQYSGIRAANFFLEASKGQTFEDFKYNQDYSDQMDRFNRYQYEVRFLRAYFYFNLVKQYGDVPFTNTVLTEDEVNSLRRIDSSDIFDFIVSECDEIVNELPVSYSSLPFNETGRINRATVLALKARALLYRASPLFNEDNDESLWLDAAIASKAVIDSCSLYGFTLGKYSDLWGTNNWTNNEIIFARRVGDINSIESNNFPVGVEGGSSGNCPTLNLVDSYQVKSTGKFWDESDSGYDPSNPFDNRDPRFYMTIAKNGDEKWPLYNTLPLQTYVGGVNGLPAAGATQTGFYLKKYLDASVDLRPVTSNTKRHSWITFRLAEFYLNYAEAVCQYLGSPDATNSELTMTATEAINVIRARSDVDMPPIADGLSVEEFEKYYESERMIELAFEGHRFWDVRRWKKGELFSNVECMRIEMVSEGVYNYSRFKKQRMWDDKMYLFPIPDAERRKNGNLTQNPGW